MNRGELVYSADGIVEECGAKLSGTNFSRDHGENGGVTHG